MTPYMKKAPLRGRADSKKPDLLGGEIKGKYTTKPTPRQVSDKLPTADKNILIARLPFAIDANEFPILARNWPLDVRQDLLRRTRREMAVAL